MSNNKTSKLVKWRNKYTSLVVTLSSLYSVIINWGENWFMTALFLAGVFICGMFSYFDLKRLFKKSN